MASAWKRSPGPTGKHQLTTTYAWFLARWAQRLSWTTVAQIFHTSWTHVYHSVAMAVAWGRAHQDLSDVTALGIDEIQWHRGHRYLTLVYQIDAGHRRLLWVGRDRTIKTVLRFFRWFGPQRTAALRFVCSDMWRPYLRVVAKKAGLALHILDRFHIMAHMNKAIDEVRAKEARALRARGHAPVLAKTRWLLLRRPEHLTGEQLPRLAAAPGLQPPGRPRLPAARGVPVLLGLPVGHLGGQVPRSLVHPDHALPPGARCRRSPACCGGIGPCCSTPGNCEFAASRRARCARTSAA